MNPNLPSATSLIDSFLKDLQGIASIFRGDTSEVTRCVALFTATGATQGWIADKDYVLVGYHISGVSGNLLKLGFDNAVLPLGNNQTVLDVVIASIASVTSSNLNYIMPGIRIPVRKDQQIYLKNSTSSNASAVLFLNS